VDAMAFREMERDQGHRMASGTVLGFLAFLEEDSRTTEQTFVSVLSAFFFDEFFPR